MLSSFSRRESTVGIMNDMIKSPFAEQEAALCSSKGQVNGTTINDILLEF